MASIFKSRNGYRVQFSILSVRESKSFSTKREANEWALQRESELRDAGKLSAGEKFTLRDALRKYANEISPTKCSSQLKLATVLEFSQYNRSDFFKNLKIRSYHLAERS